MPWQFREAHSFLQYAQVHVLARPHRLHMSVPNTIDTFTSGLTSICRLPKGITVSSNAPLQSNIRLLKLYDIENLRSCRSVRERITELDLVVEKVIPSAENSRALLDKDYNDALPTGQIIPCLVVRLSDGSDAVISGESDILDFFDEVLVDESPLTVGEGRNVDSSWLEQVVKTFQTVGYYTAGLFRMERGCRVSPVVTASTDVNRPKQPLILYSYEGNQFCRLVREVLTELDIVYELRSAGKGSPRRTELATLSGGSTQCPYLVDPNTGRSMAESADIIAYLYKEYALWTPPSEILEWASENIMSTLKPIFAWLTPLQVDMLKNVNDDDLKDRVDMALSEIQLETNGDEVVVIYTYALSPFCLETKYLLDRLQIRYKEISLGQEWLPGLLAPGGAEKRAALFQVTGQTSLPHIFIGGKPIGGLFSGNPGLIPALQADQFLQLVEQAITSRKIA